MQTCSLCNTRTDDLTTICPGCQADLKTNSVTVVALKQFQENTRVKLIYVSIADDACPTCQQYHGAYEKDSVPNLPIEGCSHKQGCRCFYEPLFDEIYP
jgi:hypothetical protein